MRTVVHCGEALGLASGAELSPPQPALVTARATSATTAATSIASLVVLRIVPLLIPSTTVKLLVTGVPALSIAHTGQIVASESCEGVLDARRVDVAVDGEREVDGRDHGRVLVAPLPAGRDLDALDRLLVAAQQHGDGAAAAAGEAGEEQAERRHALEVPVAAGQRVVDGHLVLAVAERELHGALLHGVDGEFGRHGCSFAG